MNEYHSRDELEAYPHVKGTAYGANDELIVFVTAKRAESDLDDDKIIPKEVVIQGETYQTDVVPVGIPHLTATAESETAVADHRKRHRPIPGGVSIGNAGIGAGTMGSPLLYHEDGSSVTLSNAHVAGEAAEQFQPSRMDGRGSPFGVLRESSDLNPAEPQTTDSALIAVNDESDISNDILGIGPLVDFDTSDYSHTYTKAGRTTGVTEGELRGVDANLRVSYGPDTIRFRGCDVFSRMSAPGDSGSLIGYENSEGLVATDLLFAGSDQATIGIPIISGVFREHGQLEIPDQEDDTGNGDGRDDSSDDSSGDGSDDGSDSDDDNGDDDEDEEGEGDTDAPDSTPWDYTDHQARVARIIDGDTLDFTVNLGLDTNKTDQRIRLLEIDTAERGTDDFDVHTNFVTDWVEAGREDYNPGDDPGDPQATWPFVLKTHNDERDSFGRLLTHVYRKSDGESLTDALLAEYGETVRYNLEEQLNRLLR